MKKVSDKRESRREQLVNIVRKGINDVGLALVELRDDEHWKDTGHTNFAEFCRDSFQISKTHLYDVIKGVEVMSMLPKDMRPKITSDSQALALSKVPQNNRSKVILMAEKNGPITAEKITIAARELNGHSRKLGVRNPDSPVSQPQPLTEEKSKTPTKEKEKILFDRIGTPIPLDALPWWIKRKEVQKLLDALYDLRDVIILEREKENCMWMKVTNTIESDFSYLYYLISEAKPYAVCTTCMGSPTLQPQGCSYCHNTGLISKRNWDTCSMKEIKELRIRSNQEFAKKHPESPLNKPQEKEEDVC